LGEQGRSGVEAGGAVVEILLSGDLEPWIEQFSLEVTVVRPKDEATRDAFGGREWTHIVDLSTGKMVWSEFGSFSSSGESSVGSGIAEMKRLLAE
jgi:hypothetical protein